VKNVLSRGADKSYKKLFLNSDSDEVGYPSFAATQHIYWALKQQKMHLRPSPAKHPDFGQLDNY